MIGLLGKKLGHTRVYDAAGNAIAVLMEACVYFTERKKQRLTFEYILIEGVNDEPAHAADLVQLARKVGAKVNCIPYNVVEGLEWKRPGEARQDAFMAVLENARIPATIRREKGHDIAAACGQLALKGHTALMMAAPYGSAELIRLLLNAKADVNARNALEADFRTALIEGQFLLHYQPQVDLKTGQIVGMEESVSGKVVTAEVPLAEMFQYSTAMRSMSQGRATYTMEFSKYAEVPSNVSAVITNQN